MHFGISEYMRVEAFITASKLAQTIAHKSNNNTGTSINSQTHKRGTTGGHKVSHKHWEQQQHWHLNKQSNTHKRGTTGGHKV